MLSRSLLALVTLFFLTMNFLLWRYEISGRGKLGSPVPVEMVWLKMLTAPDRSALEIRHRGRRIGYCRWSPNFGEEMAADRLQTDTFPPEGMVWRISGYRVDLDGGVFLEDMGHVRFNSHLQLDTNHLWQELNLRLNWKPRVCEVEALAAAQLCKLRIQEADGQRTEQTFRFDQLRDPQQLLARLGGPVLSELLQMAGLPLPANPGDPGLVAPQWTARQDSLRVGRIRIHVYRVETKLFDRFQIAIVVSRVGEILRVELPGQVFLVNDAFLQL